MWVSLWKHFAHAADTQLPMCFATPSGRAVDRQQAGLGWLAAWHAKGHTTVDHIRWLACQVPKQGDCHAMVILETLQAVLGSLSAASASTWNYFTILVTSPNCSLHLSIQCTEITRAALAWFVGPWEITADSANGKTSGAYFVHGSFRWSTSAFFIKFFFFSYFKISKVFLC